MNNYNHSFRVAIENGILTSFLYQDLLNELDQMEYADFILPYEHFKATRTHKLVAKAIFVLQQDKKPISDFMVLNFLESKTTFNEQEMLDILSATGFSFHTMNKYLNILQDMNKEEERLSNLEGVL